eukprot:6543508-Lingulodinium_polyedra.AAC.1
MKKQNAGRLGERRRAEGFDGSRRGPQRAPARRATAPDLLLLIGLLRRLPRRCVAPPTQTVGSLGLRPPS